ncbi:MAG: hypothetical protein H6817_11825 [Phycisphaerales bacterium]|nr:hypothetical protein [Phycisphaerales bacterium]
MASSPASTTPFAPPVALERFRANLDALAPRQPALARELADTPIPSTARIVTGRDGTPVALCSENETLADWLGGTSMPTISSPELLRETIDRGVSVVLPTVGSGHEAPMLADRLEPHAAVFVCAPDPVRVVLALHAADWTRHLRQGRIVILAGDTEAALAEFLEQHPGYQIPARLQPLPDARGHALAECTQAVQRGAQRAGTAQQQMLVRLTQQVTRRRARRTNARPRVLILSTDAVGGAIEFAAHVDSVLGALGIDSARCLPDAPDKCHRIARIAALRDHDPDWVLLLNSTPGPLRDCWPEGLPYACWFLESPFLPAQSLVGISDCENLYAASTAVRDRLVVAGAKPDAVSILEPGVDDTTFYPLPEAERVSDHACDVAVFADGFDLAPAASGIALETHERLWRVAADVCAERCREGDAPDAGTLLELAERAADVKLADAEQRREFIGLLDARMVRTVAAMTAVEELVALDDWTSIGLWGAGWEKHASLRDAYRGATPPAAQRNRIHQSASIVVFPQVTPLAVRGVFEVAGSGGCPVIAKPDDATLARYPQSCQILSLVSSFSGAKRLGRLVRRLVSDIACRSRTAEKCRTEALRNHALRDRLTTLHTQLTARPS